MSDPDLGHAAGATHGAEAGGSHRGGTLGELLRKARDERGLELTDIAELTHVRREYLRALEEGRFEDLPEDVYTKNFVRLYAQATGLDVDSTLETYTRERRSAVGMTTLEESLDRDRRGEPPPRTSGPVSGLGTLLPTLLLVAVVVALAVWGYNSLLFRPSKATAEPTAPAAARTNDPVDSAAAGGGSVANPGSLDAPAGTVGSTVEDRTVRVSIESEPTGASVTIDGFALPGTTPIVNAPVTAREGRIVRVTLEGYEPVEQAIDMRSDQRLQVTLAPRTAAVADPAAAGGGTTAAIPAGKIGIDITEPTWLEVYQSTARNTGARLVYTTAQPGASYVFDLPVFVHVGNAAGVHIKLDGQDRGAMGSSGAVLSQAFPAP